MAEFPSFLMLNDIPLYICIYGICVINKIVLKIIYFIYFWLHRVLAAAQGSSLRRAGFFVMACRFFVAALGLLSSCGVQVFSSLVVACRFQSVWAL